MARKPLGNRRRFTIFQRDGFRCQYCGKSPPAAVLHVDHVVPVAEGGQNEDSNLVTACSDCNHGKWKHPIDQSAVPMDYARLADEAREKKEQLGLYREHLAQLRAEIEQAVDDVGNAYFGAGFIFSPEAAKERHQIERFIERLGLADVLKAARAAYAKWPSGNRSKFGFFCAVIYQIATERGIRIFPGDRDA